MGEGKGWCKKSEQRERFNNREEKHKEFTLSSYSLDSHLYKTILYIQR